MIRLRGWPNRFGQLVRTLSRPSQEGEMDAKPKADKPTDFELEQAIFEAP
jgi:hypothetical protein